jgi:hypothetical protein
MDMPPSLIAARGVARPAAPRADAVTCVENATMVSRLSEMAATIAQGDTQAANAIDAAIRALTSAKRLSREGNTIARS